MIVDKPKYIDNLLNITYYARAMLDKDPKTMTVPQRYAAQAKYEAYLQEKIKNPIAASIAMRDEVRRHPIEDMKNFTQNRIKLEKNPAIDTLVKEIEKIESNHGRTSYLRQEMIARNRINLHFIMPKMTKMQKLAFKLRLMF